jgi:hypothetical protein
VDLPLPKKPVMRVKGIGIVVCCKENGGKEIWVKKKKKNSQSPRRSLFGERLVPRRCSSPLLRSPFFVLWTFNLFSICAARSEMKLTYFAARGVCDQIRLLLAECDIQYDQITLTPREYLQRKASFPLGDLPLWGTFKKKKKKPTSNVTIFTAELIHTPEEGTLRLTHASAIMRHLAR